MLERANLDNSAHCKFRVDRAYLHREEASEDFGGKAEYEEEEERKKERKNRASTLTTGCLRLQGRHNHCVCHYQGRVGQ